MQSRWTDGAVVFAAAGVADDVLRTYNVLRLHSRARVGFGQPRATTSTG